MVDLARIQAHVNKGYGKAAVKLGLDTCQWYRPNGPVNPISLQTQLGTITAQIANKPNFGFADTSGYAKAVQWGLFDPTETQVGDYIVYTTSTYFIAAQRAIQPTMLVACNHVISIVKLAAPVLVGTNPYGGRTEATDVPLLTNWPASVLLGTKGEGTVAHLPADSRAAWWTALLPAWPGVILHMGDEFEDETGHRYVISGTELTDLGWRLICGQLTT